MKFPKALLIRVILPLWMLPHASHGVIVAGANGGGNTLNNTTRPQLESALSTVFPIYDNVINYSDASGTYLGYNPSTMDIWVISARHVSDSNADISIGGLPYTFQERVNLSGDIQLNRYNRLDGIVPAFAAVPLATTIPTANTDLVLIGIGKNRVEDAATGNNTNDSSNLGGSLSGYNWAGDRIKRWGTNQAIAEFPDSLEISGEEQSGVLGNFDFVGGTQAFSMRFDQPANGQWRSSNEAAGSLGDSGGGVFAFVNGEWVLTGIFSAVTSFQGQNSNSSAFGNQTIATDISSYRDDILAVTGVLIPEPTSALLVLVGGVLFMRRKR